MTPQKPDSTGRFVKKSIIRSTVVEDCSTWDARAGEASRTTGRFVKGSLVRPAIAADCSDWCETPTDQAEVTQPDDVANTAYPPHDRDFHLVGETANGVWVIHSTQRQLDELEGKQLAKLVHQGGANNILLNLSGVDVVSSSFIGGLLKVHQQIRSVGGRFALCNLGRQVQEAFSLLHLEGVFAIYSSQDQALQIE
jgi:anti-anti-sigma factor